MFYFDYLYYNIYKIYTTTFRGGKDSEQSCIAILSLFQMTNLIFVNYIFILFFDLNIESNKIYESLTLSDLPPIILGVVYLWYNHYRYFKVITILDIEKELEKKPASNNLNIGVLIYVILTVIGLIIYLTNG